MNYLLQLDRSLFITINTDWTNSVFDMIMPWITHLADPSIVWLWIISIGLLKVKQFAIPGKSTLSNYKIKSSVGNFNLNLEDYHQYHLSYRLLALIPIDLYELGEVGLSTEEICGYHAIIAEWDRFRILAGVKVNRQPIHEAWKSRLGTYRLVNPPPTDIFNLKKFEVNIEDGYLVEALTFPENTFTQILRTVNDHEAVIEGLGRGMGETVRIINSENGEILTYAGLRFERIKE